MLAVSTRDAVNFRGTSKMGEQNLDLFFITMRPTMNTEQNLLMYHIRATLILGQIII